MNTTSPLDTRKDPAVRFIVILRDEPGRHPAPVHRRLARLLKGALRAYGLRCVRIREAKVKREFLR